MNDFEALIRSLGEQSVTYIGGEHLSRLTVWGDQAAGSAEIEISLADDSWAERSAAVDRMVEIRGMFIDEVAISYRFVSVDNFTEAVAELSEYSYA